LKINVEAETRGVSEDQDYLRNDPFVYVPVSVPEEIPEVIPKTEDSKDEENTTLRTTIGGMLNTFDDLGDDIYSDGDDDSVYGGTIQTIRNMPYSHDYVPQVNVESYKPLPRATIPLSEKTIVTKGGSDSQWSFHQSSIFRPLVPRNPFTYTDWWF
jgi:hypothetical protein